MPGDPFEIIFVLILLVVVFIAFVKEVFPPDIVAMSAMGILVVTGILGESDVMAVFSNHAPITIGAMFVLSAALSRTGAIERLAGLYTRFAGTSDTRILIVLALMVMPISACMNNTPIVVIFLPIMLSFARTSGVKASRLLIPLSFFTILGGTLTMIGTSTNILVGGVVAEQGLEPFGIFEITKMGLIYAIFGIAYLLTIGKKLLPHRDTLSSLLSTEDTRSFYTHAVIQKNSPMIGRQLISTPLLKNKGIRVFEVIRDGMRISDTPIDELACRAGDILVLTAPSRAIAEIQETNGLDFRGEDQSSKEVRKTNLKLVEAIVGPQSALIGKTIRQLGFRRRYGVRAAAVHRKGVNLFDNYLDVSFKFGDTVIFEGPEQNLSKMQQEEDFLSLNEKMEKPFRRNKAPLAIGALLTVMVVSALGWLPISIAALAAAIFIVVTRCVDFNDLYSSVDWSILFLIFGMLGMGKAMENTGAAAMIAEGAAALFSPYGPLVVLAAVYFLASVLTELVTNNAVAIILAPITIGIAQSLDLDPRPFVVAVMFGASASFMTPIGYQTNTYIYGAGGYKFLDFTKVGTPLSLLLWIVAIIFIPIFWPFVPTS